MDNNIDPKITAILDQLDAMKDSVITAGRGAADHGRLNKELRCELDDANCLIAADRVALRRANKIVDASTILMIVGWSLAAICLTGWMLS